MQNTLVRATLTLPSSLVARLDAVAPLSPYRTRSALVTHLVERALNASGCTPAGGCHAPPATAAQCGTDAAHPAALADPSDRSDMVASVSFCPDAAHPSAAARPGTAPPRGVGAHPFHAAHLRRQFDAAERQRAALQAVRAEVLERIESYKENDV